MDQKKQRLAGIFGPDGVCDDSASLERYAGTVRSNRSQARP